MLQRGIKRQHTSEDLNALTSLDLIETHLAIAMCEAEHRPMMMEKYPLWVDHVIYWRVRDLPDSQPSEAIPEIERQVFLLLDGISASNPIDTPVAGCLIAQRLIPTGERSGLHTGTATTESVSLCVQMKS